MEETGGASTEPSSSRDIRIQIESLEKDIITLYNCIDALERLANEKDTKLINLWKIYNLKLNKGE